MELFRNEYGYAPLRSNLEGYWDKSFEQLPDELKELVEPAFFPHSWDSVENRRSLAAQIDYQNDPNMEWALYFKLACFKKDIAGWIEAARTAGSDARVVVLRDVADCVEQMLEVDRGRVGVEIQRLLQAQGGGTASGGEATTKGNEDDSPTGAVTPETLSPRAETTYLNIIGGLLVLMLGNSPAGKPQSVFGSQTAIIDALLGHFQSKPGIAPRTLQEKFAAATRSLNAT